MAQNTATKSLYDSDQGHYVGWSCAAQVHSDSKEEELIDLGTFLLTRYVASRFKVYSERLDQDDLNSVLKRIEKEEPPDGFRFYTAPHSKDGDGFILVVITPLRAEWLRQFSYRGIGIDDTFNKLKLAAVVVVDQYDRGLPAAFLLSYRMTHHEVAVSCLMTPPRFLMGSSLHFRILPRKKYCVAGMSCSA
ncbi:hypothetical protein Aduo_012527 [Ancylostoma duodenale]